MSLGAKQSKETGVVEQTKNGQGPDNQGPVRSDPFFPPVRIQPKLSINTPGDQYEQEADAVADKVMRMPDPASPARQSFFSPSNIGIQRKVHQPEDELDKEILHRKEISTSTIQRKCSACEEEDHQVQRKESGGGSIPDSGLDNYVSSLSSSGQALPETALSFFEPRFGQDFSGVRIHSDRAAADSAQSINAQAYTTGNNIVFNQGKFSPDSNDGKQLLAHELTHVVQQGNDQGLQTSLIQTNLAIAPTVPGAVVNALTPAQLQSAIQWNTVVFSDATEIALLREVLQISQAPAVINEDFINALVQYQANFGLTQDGRLGAATASRLADELAAEAGIAGATPDVGTATELALNPAERRMRLRSRVVNRLGRILHQGFIGPADNPTGIVTARSGFTNPGNAGLTNAIGVNYTGAHADQSHWLQFLSPQMSAIDTTTHHRVFNTANVVTTGAPFVFAAAGAFNWGVDTLPATNSMFYDAGFTNTRVPGASTEIFDQPNTWNGQADTFAATFATRPASVRLTLRFDDYLVVNNNSVVYHFRWNMYFNFNTTVAPAPDVRGSYESLGGGPVNHLPADRKAALNAQFAGNTVP